MLDKRSVNGTSAPKAQNLRTGRCPPALESVHFRSRGAGGHLLPLRRKQIHKGLRPRVPSTSLSGLG